MTLRVNDTPDFNVSLNLNINYDLEYIELTVNTWNKKKHAKQTKQVPASDFSQALAYYKQQQTMFC